MPCYVEPPSVSEYAWLKHMFLQAIEFLTPEQKELIKLNEIMFMPSEGKFREGLCKVCKFLSIDQMRSVHGLDIYIGLYQWYKQHLISDFSKNYDNTDSKEKAICLKEAERLGLIIEKNDYGIGFSIHEKTGGMKIIHLGT